MQKQHWILTSITLAGIFFGILAGVFFLLFHDLPEINTLKQFKPSSVTTVLSSDQKILTRFYTEKRFPVSINKIPQHLITSIITIEDRYFFSHSGINIKAILRAFIHDLKAMKFKQGASTLTQQLAKTLFLTSEKSIIRKIKEALLAVQIERRYTKNEILELYLNQIYFGSGAYGVEAACQTYFNTSVSDINLAQAAIIAGLPKAPSVYSPLKNPSIARKRRHIVLRQLYETKKISKEDFIFADNQEISSPPKKSIQDQTAYFIEYVRSYLKNQLDFQATYSNGLTIHTTLNYRLQTIAQSAVAKQMARIEARMKKNHISSEKLECAVIAIDIKSGAILSMIGGKNFNQSNFNRAVQARRQPGSAFKPFVYATAINQGASQENLILDAPLSYPLNNGKVWNVHNFSKTYMGKITFRKALALSKNTPAVRLIEQITPSRIIDFATAAGISSKLHSNLSLALGTSEVNLMELTAAYIPFANMGIKVTPFSIKKIIDTNLRVIYQNTINKQSIMSRQNAAVITDMLKAAITEGTGKKAMVVKTDIAGKTGTTDNYKDALFIGYSPDTVLGVWVGNDDSTSLGKYETGAKAALPIWIDIMEHLADKKSWQYFDIPDGTKMVYMNPDTGRISQTQTRRTVKALIKTKDAK